MNKIKAEYIWLDGQDYPMPHPRSKVRVLDMSEPLDLMHFPEWSFDGGSTGQAGLRDSDVTLKPVRLYTNPLTENGVFVLCEVMTPEGLPHVSNHRSILRHLSASKWENADDMWFGFEQEYTLFIDEDTPLAWANGEPQKQGNYYCGVGSEHAFGREIVEAHLDACLEAGVDLYGTNAEVMPSQWEFQTGPQNSLKAADDLWMARYILERICEQHGVYASFHPKPAQGEWNGAGCHTNFSTKSMREDSAYLVEAIHRLASRHEAHMAVYGEYNDQRMTGDCETSNFKEFTSGDSDRGASIRTPISTAKNNFCGHLEDRRPAANIDPYKVCSRIIKSVCLDLD